MMGKWMIKWSSKSGKRKEVRKEWVYKGSALKA